MLLVLQITFLTPHATKVLQQQQNVPVNPTQAAQRETISRWHRNMWKEESCGRLAVIDVSDYKTNKQKKQQHDKVAVITAPINRSISIRREKRTQQVVPLVFKNKTQKGYQKEI